MVLYVSRELHYSLEFIYSLPIETFFDIIEAISPKEKKQKGNGKQQIVNVSQFNKMLEQANK